MLRTGSVVRGLRGAGRYVSVVRRVTAGLLSCVAGCAAVSCGPSSPPSSPSKLIETTLLERKPASWFEHLTNSARVSPDGRWAIYGTAPRLHLIDLQTGADARERLLGPFAAVDNATFGPQGRLVRLASAEGAPRGWYIDGDSTALPLPEDAVPVWSASGRRLATIRSSARREGIAIDGRNVAVPGHILSVAWTPDDQRIIVLTRTEDYHGTLHVVAADTGATRLVADGLDTDVFPAQFAVLPDGRSVVMALASGGRADAEARHHPAAGRELDLWVVDLETGARRVLVEQPGDDFAPHIVGDRLVWTHAEIRPSVAVVPVAGGDARTLVDAGELPYWSADGRQVGFMVGGWRLRDVALPLDVHVVDVDSEVRPLGPPRPLITGFHEDFTPAWSPDGRWLAFHSHRSPTAVPSYFSAGSTDDVWLALASDPSGSERRLTDFGHESGMAAWAPDGRRLAFVSYDKHAPTTLQTWILTIDLETGALTDASRLALPPSISSTETIAWSPDGETLAIESKTTPGTHALWLLSLQTGQARRLSEHSTATFGGVNWTPDGTTIVYGALAGDRMQLFSTPVGGGASRQLTRSEASVFLPQVSPDGRWIAATAMRHTRRVISRPLP